MPKSNVNGPLTGEDIAEFTAELIAKIGAEKLDELRRATYCYRIMMEIYYLDTTEADAITNDIFHDMDGAVPYAGIKQIVHDFLPEVLASPFFVDGVMTDEAIQISIAHNKMLELNKVRRSLQ